MRKLLAFLRGFGLVAGLVVGLLIWSKLPWPAVLVLLVLLGLWLGLTRRGRQTLSITGVGISTLRQRVGASLVVVIGIAGVVGVLVAMLAMGEGFQQTLQQTGTDDTAIVLRGGSNAELNSVLDRDSVNV
ncbi:MAG TPA: ABC transporter permease, partial [Rhodanobacter sp.]